MRAVVLEAVYRCDWREMSVCERLKRLKKTAKISSLVCPRSLAPATVDVWRHAFFEALSSSAQKVLLALVLAHRCHLLIIYYYLRVKLEERRCLRLARCGSFAYLE